MKKKNAIYVLLALALVANILLSACAPVGAVSVVSSEDATRELSPIGLTNNMAGQPQPERPPTPPPPGTVVGASDYGYVVPVNPFPVETPESPVYQQLLNHCSGGDQIILAGGRIEPCGVRSPHDLIQQDAIANPVTLLPLYAMTVLEVQQGLEAVVALVTVGEAIFVAVLPAVVSGTLVTGFVALSFADLANYQDDAALMSAIQSRYPTVTYLSIEDQIDAAPAATQEFWTATKLFRESIWEGSTEFTAADIQSVYATAGAGVVPVPGWGDYDHTNRKDGKSWKEHILERKNAGITTLKLLLAYEALVHTADRMFCSRKTFRCVLITLDPYVGIIAGSFVNEGSELEPVLGRPITVFWGNDVEEVQIRRTGCHSYRLYPFFRFNPVFEPPPVGEGTCMENGTVYQP